MRFWVAVALVAGVFAGPAFAGSLEDTQANIHYNLALELYQAQKLDEARDTLAKALALSPKHPQANFLSGLIACRQDRFEDAVNPLKIAVSELPEPADALSNLGVAYFQLGRLGEAEDVLKRAAARKPDRADVALDLGLVELRLKRFAAAEPCFVKVTAAENGDVRAWLGLAESADGAGDTLAALDARENALRLQPADKDLRLELGEKLYQAQRITRAAEVLQPLQGTGDASAEFLLGVLEYRQGAFIGSRERFEAALADRPDYPEARYNLAITYYDQGLYEEALKQFSAVLDRHPDDEDARKNLEITRAAAVRSRLKSGSQDFLKADYTAALKQWKAALALNSGDKVVKDLVDTAETQLKLQSADLAGQGNRDWDLGKKEQAIGEWSQALERDAANAEAHKGLDGAKEEIEKMADAFIEAADDDIAQGRWAMARETAARVSNLDAAKGRNLSESVETAARNQYSEAVAAADAAAQKGALAARVDNLEKAVEAEPADGSVQLKLNLAKVAFRQALNDAAGAAEAAEKALQWEEAVRQYRRVLDLQASNPEAKEALKRLSSRAVPKGPDPSELEDLYYQGVYAYAAGDLEKAELLWKRVLAADPRHALAKAALERSRRNRRAAQKP